MQLTPNFSSDEFDVNEPVPALYAANRANLAALLQAFRDVLCAAFGKDVPITITSCYRDPARNVGIQFHARDSQHLTASAADVDVHGVSMQDVARVVAEDTTLHYSQAIFYVGDHHVHLGILDPVNLPSKVRQQLVHYDDGGYYRDLTAETLTDLSAVVFP